VWAPILNRPIGRWRRPALDAADERDRAFGRRRVKRRTEASASGRYASGPTRIGWGGGYATATDLNRLITAISGSRHRKFFEQISCYAAERGRTLQMLDVPLDEWPQLVNDHPRAAFSHYQPVRSAPARCVPRGCALLDPPLQATLIARTDGSVEATAFLEHLQSALANDRPSRALAPVLTERRLRYFNPAYEVGRLSHVHVAIVRTDFPDLRRTSRGSAKCGNKIGGTLGGTAPVIDRKPA